MLLQDARFFATCVARQLFEMQLVLKVQSTCSILFQGCRSDANCPFWSLRSAVDMFHLGNAGACCFVLRVECQTLCTVAGEGLHFSVQILLMFAWADFAL